MGWPSHHAPVRNDAGDLPERERGAAPRPRPATGGSGGGSGRAAADQPDGGGEEQQRQGEQPAALDPLERPEPASRLVPGPVRVAVLGEVLNRARERLLLEEIDIAAGYGLYEPGEYRVHDLDHR